MSWLKSIQKLTRLVVFLEKIWKPTLGALEVLAAALAALVVPLAEPLVAVLAPLAVALAGALVAVLAPLAAALKKKEKNGPRLILPPGTGLRNVLHVIYPPKTAERVFDQIIADMQLEWQEAMAKDQGWLARWVRVRGVLTVILTAAVHVVATLGSIFKLVK